MENSFVNYDEYLIALEMKAKIGAISKNQIGRFSQLINKSNQFNLRTMRYTESIISDQMNDSLNKCIFVELNDKFTDYGLISCAILRKIDDICFIDTWVMSCRVLKRGVEFLMFDYIQEIACEWQCHDIVGEYIPTTKNSMVKDLYKKLEFSELKEATTIRKATGESTLYRYPTTQKTHNAYYIEKIS